MTKLSAALYNRKMSFRFLLKIALLVITSLTIYLTFSSKFLWLTFARELLSSMRVNYLLSVYGVTANTKVKDSDNGPRQTYDGWPMLSIELKNVWRHGSPIAYCHVFQHHPCDPSNLLENDLFCRSKPYFTNNIPLRPFRPNSTIKWNYDTRQFQQRDDVIRGSPKIITYVVKTPYMIPLPEPVRLRSCPEMPCRLTTNTDYLTNSAALLWAGQIMRASKPPPRTNRDQVFVFHNHEPQTPDWTMLPSFRKPSWKSVFNWTMTYRFDSDIIVQHGYVQKRSITEKKNYTEIVAKKSRFAALLVSHCQTHGLRERYVKLLRKHILVDSFGACAKSECPRRFDNSCFEMISKEYQFFFAFENSICKDYVSEKFFRYLDADTVVVARGSNQYKNHAPNNIFINTADFKTTKDLAEYLLYLDSNPQRYIQYLKAKDSYQSKYEEWPIREGNGQIKHMHYHYEAVSYCELCLRLWNLDTYRKNIPDIVEWFDKGNCVAPTDFK